MAQTAGPSEQLLEEAKQAVWTQHLRYQELFDLGPDGQVTTDSHGIIREANHAAATLLQVRKEFLIGKPLPSLVADADRSTFYKKLSQLGQTGGATDWEVSFRRARSGTVDVLLRVAAFPESGGLLGGFRWVLRDATTFKRAEQAFRAAKSFSDVLVDTAQSIILVVTTSGHVVRSNPFLTKLLGMDQMDVHGQDWCGTLIADEDRPVARIMLARALDSGDNEKGVFSLVGKEGQRRSVIWSAKCIPSPVGDPVVLLTGQDITELEDAQRQALHTARLAAVGQTMAGLAHEGRNALQRTHACLARLEWALQGRPEELDLVIRAQKAQDDLHRLFDDVQGYAAPINLEWGHWDLAEVWREAWAELTLRHGRRDVEFHEVIVASPYCAADRFRIRQVFRNAFENALDACRDPVRVRVECHDSALGDRAAVQVLIRDNGPGLAPEQRQKIFEPFFTTKVKGTGLGMAIALRVLEAHGGRIAVGEEGPGAEIVITLPRNRP